MKNALNQFTYTAYLDVFDPSVPANIIGMATRQWGCSVWLAVVLSFGALISIFCLDKSKSRSPADFGWGKVQVCNVNKGDDPLGIVVDERLVARGMSEISQFQITSCLPLKRKNVVLIYYPNSIGLQGKAVLELVISKLKQGQNVRYVNSEECAYHHDDLDGNHLVKCFPRGDMVQLEGIPASMDLKEMLETLKLLGWKQIILLDCQDESGAVASALKRNGFEVILPAKEFSFIWKPWVPPVAESVDPASDPFAPSAAAK